MATTSNAAVLAYLVRCPTCGWEGQRGKWVRDRYAPTGLGKIDPSEVAGPHGRPCLACNGPVELVLPPAKQIVRCALCALGMPERCTGFVSLPVDGPQGQRVVECGSEATPRGAA